MERSETFLKLGNACKKTCDVQELITVCFRFSPEITFLTCLFKIQTDTDIAENVLKN